MSVLDQLVRNSDGGSAAPAPARVDAPEAEEREDAVESESEADETKTASQRARDLLLGARDLEAECTKLAADLRGEMEKTASEGGEGDENAEEFATFMEKVASTLRVQRVYADGLRKQGEANARTCEALKVASDLIGRGLLDVAEGQSMVEVVEELASKDLKAVKVASEMFSEQAVTNALGSAEKLGTEKPAAKLDGSMKSWADAHSFLFQ